MDTDFKTNSLTKAKEPSLPYYLAISDCLLHSFINSWSSLSTQVYNKVTHTHLSIKIYFGHIHDKILVLVKNNLTEELPSIMYKKWRCTWSNGYRRRNWTRRHEFKSWTRLMAFHIALVPLGKVGIQLFSFQLWVNSRTD